MTARWSAGFVIGLPIACVAVVAVIAFTIYAWKRGDHREFSDMMSGWRILAWVGTVLSVALLLGLPWAFFPWSAQYHRWVPRVGTVSTIGGRFTTGTASGDTSGSVWSDYVVQFSGSPVRYDCQDTRCALVHPGDRLALSCIRVFQWTGIPGWNCKLRPRRERGDVMTPTSAQLWALVCGSGEVHKEGGEVPTGVTQECAEGAAEFMDEARSDGTGWHCGPHKVVPYSVEMGPSR